MVNHTATDRPLRRSRAFRVVAVASSALVMLTTVELSADRRSSGGSVRQSNNTSRNTGANRDNNYDRNTNANQPEHQRQPEHNGTQREPEHECNNNVNVNRNTNVNVNRNVNVNAAITAARAAWRSVRKARWQSDVAEPLPQPTKGSWVSADTAPSSAANATSRMKGGRWRRAWRLVSRSGRCSPGPRQLPSPSSPAGPTTCTMMARTTNRSSTKVRCRIASSRRLPARSSRRCQEVHHDRDGRRLGAAVRNHLLQARQHRLPGRGVLIAPHTSPATMAILCRRRGVHILRPSQS